jgi:hypothetical protein
MQKIQEPRNWWPLAVVVLCGVVIGFQNCSNVGFNNGNGVNAFGGIIPDTPDTPAHFPPVNPQKPLCTQISQNIQPKLMWDWYSQLGASDFHGFNQIMAAPVVADLDNDNQPKVVVVTGSIQPADQFNPDQSVAWYEKNGVLRIIDGKTGTNLVSVGSQALAPFSATTALLVDLDNDGKFEIVYLHYTGTKIIALNHDGSFRWSYAPPALMGGGCFAGLSTADLDLNGKAEILYQGYVLEENAAGVPTLKMDLNQTVSATDGSCLGFASVLDAANPHFSVVTPKAVFDNTGKQMFALNGAAYMAVGKVRSDLSGNQIVSVGNQRLRIFDGNSGALLTDKDLMTLSQFTCGSGTTASIGGGPPSIGDFVGDGTFQIAIATGQYIMIFDGRGNVLATSHTQDCSSEATAVTSFDFDGDGKPEILYGDENYFRIYHLVNGQLVTVAQFVNPSGTLVEFPVVADITGDGSARLLVVSNNYAVDSVYTSPQALADKATAAGITGIRAFESADGLPWMPTRHTFNQYHFNASLVNEVGRVFDPAEASQSWLGKTFRLNAQVTMTQPICQR